MKTLLRDGGGIPNTLLYTLAIIAGISVANLYYNQPLLEMLRQDLHASTMEANHIALYTQIGYALGLLFIIPLADLFSRKRIILANFSILVVSLLAIATAGNIYTVHVFSLLTGICSVIPQIFIPLTAQYSLPENKNRNVGIVLSGLLTGILASRVVSGAVGEWLGWREMYYIASGLMGYLIRDMKAISRVALVIGGLLMVIPGTVTDLAGLAVLVVVLVLQRIENKKDKAAASV